MVYMPMTKLQRIPPLSEVLANHPTKYEGKAIYVSKDHHVRLRLLAAKNGVFMKQLIERMIDKEYSEQGELWGANTEAIGDANQRGRQLPNTSPDPYARSDGSLGEAEDG